MMKKALLLLLSPLLMYGESLVIDIKGFSETSWAIATLFKTDAVQDTITINSEWELKKILRKEVANHLNLEYIGRVTFNDLEPGTYRLDIAALKKFEEIPLEIFVYDTNLTISQDEFKKLSLSLTSLRKGIGSPVYGYDCILAKLNQKKLILNKYIELNPGESYINNLNVDGKEVCIKIIAKYYSRHESASIGRGDRFGSNGLYLVKNDPSLEIRLSVDSKSVYSSPCYFDEYSEIKNWKPCYSDVITYKGDKISLTIDPFILEFYPFLSAKTGMGGGFLKNHFYFEGINTNGSLYLYQMEKGKVKIKKGKYGEIEIIE